MCSCLPQMIWPQRPSCDIWLHKALQQAKELLPGDGVAEHNVALLAVAALSLVEGNTVACSQLPLWVKA